MALGVMQQLFTIKPCGKLWCAACSTIYNQPFSILVVIPGIVNMVFPGITNWFLAHANSHCAHRPI